MKRFLIDLALMLSTLVLLALTAAWIASPWRSSALALFAHNGSVQLILSHRHHLLLGFSNIPFADQPWTLDATTPTPDEGQDLIDLLTKNVPFDRSLLGLRLLRGPQDPFGFTGRWYTALILPTWLPIVLFAIAPSLLLRHRLIRHRRLRRGACLNCGYDLRESKDRCPECGATIPESSGATQQKPNLPTPAPG